ncbi:WhiB family transcriptional regulator [Microbacterium karelineae]|uniref:WhiB family transcriptional regulator n=1 Tax=Microbacterium karelineae TaxID=2654283 RepID=UPI001E2A6745|nr:WhiB family transcriptional regulator [Microbacterium karelineae]
MSEWTERAACSGMDTELFFPTSELHDAGLAKAVCEECPVRQDCLEQALRNRETDGVFGGQTAAERRAMARKLGIPEPRRKKADR